MIAYSLIHLIKFIFTIPNGKSILSERISQNPFEEFFGKQRHRGAVNKNPTSHQFLKNNQALRVVNSIKIDLQRGNTRGSNTEKVTTVSTAPLPKRRKICHSSG